MQKRIDSDKSVRALEAFSLDAFGIEQRLDYGRFPAGYNERRVDFAGDQFLSRNLRRKPR